MSYKAITIYTPEGTTPHITAQDDAFIHRSLAGGRSGILGGLQCIRVDDTTVRLSGGGALNKGYVIWVPDGLSCDLTADTGTQSLRRHDIVAAEFIRGGGAAADTHVFKIIKGAASTEPADPVLTTSDLLSAGSVSQLALFRIVLNGLSIEDIQPIAPLVNTPEYICCGGVSNVSCEDGVITKVAVTDSGAIGELRSFKVQDGAVRCEVDGVVEVSGSVHMQGTPSPDKYYGCYIKHNESELTPGIRPAVLYGAVSAPPQLVRVSAGDTITLFCRTSAESGMCVGSNSSTWLRVRYT